MQLEYLFVYYLLRGLERRHIPFDQFVVVPPLLLASKQQFPLSVLELGKTVLLFAEVAQLAFAAALAELGRSHTLEFLRALPVLPVIELEQIVAVVR